LLKAEVVFWRIIEKAARLVVIRRYRKRRLLEIAFARGGGISVWTGPASAGGNRQFIWGAWSCFITEIVMTAMFLFIIMGSTHGRAPVGFAPIAIGLGLTLIHLVSIPVTNTSVNPARSIGPALFAGSWALGQLWMFIVAPIIGGILGGIIYRGICEQPSARCR
jgi:glycerol uptake facilitator-like aquaporin